MKTENEEQEVENSQEQNNENQKKEIEENESVDNHSHEKLLDNDEKEIKEKIKEQENKYKAQIEQLSSELEIEKKLNQSIKRKPEQEEIIEKLKSKLDERQVKCNKLKITNERQRQAIDQLTRELENSYKKKIEKKMILIFQNIKKNQLILF